MKKIILMLIIATAHFTLSKLVPILTLVVMDTGIAGHAAGRIFIKFLVFVTKLLYFPLLSFALYSRHWFPGYWINSVIFINSLLWAVGIVIVFTLYRRHRNLP